MCPRPSLQVSPAAELMQAACRHLSGHMTLPRCKADASSLGAHVWAHVSAQLGFT